MPIKQIATYDSTGRIGKVFTISAGDSEAIASMVTANTPAGSTALEVPDGHDAMVHPTHWTVKAGSLTAKTKVSLSASALSLIANISVTPPVSASLKVIPNIGIQSVVAGILSAAFKPGTYIVSVDQSDPDYWSDGVVFTV